MFPYGLLLRDMGRSAMPAASLFDTIALCEKITQLENQIRETEERIEAEQVGFRTTNGARKTEQNQLKNRAEELTAKLRVAQNRLAELPQFKTHLERIAEIIYRDE
jgi:TolA-binding protein